jgi:protein-S-isoprenylcysteine O-methyltransferase Ste14
MLGKYEFLISILSAWILSAIIFTIIRHKRTILPNGSIVIDQPKLNIDIKLPGSVWSRLFILVGLGWNMLCFILSWVLYIFDLWNVCPWIYVDFPRLINWFGIVFIWLYYWWGVEIFYYNVSYLPLYKPLPDKYVLATGGPYKIIRHPMYVCKVLSGIFLFMACGLWLQFLGLILVVIALPTQARGEETLLINRYGAVYTEYLSRTGRFFPKIIFFKKQTK